MAYGQGFIRDGEHVPAEQVLMTSDQIIAEQKSKVSSPELASLAAKYLNMSDVELEKAVDWDSAPIMDDIRSLAASVLAQAEQRTDPNGAYKP